MAREQAEIGGLEAVETEGPVLAGGVKDLRRRRDRLRVLLDLDRRHDGENVRLLDIHRDVDFVLVGHPFDTVFELVGRNAEGAARLRRALGDLVKLMRNQAGHEHAVARHGNEPRNVDAHRAHQRAASANGAAVVQQVLPLFELVDGDLLLEAEQAIEECEWPCFAFVGLLE